MNEEAAGSPPIHANKKILYSEDRPIITKANSLMSVEGMEETVDVMDATVAIAEIKQPCTDEGGEIDTAVPVSIETSTAIPIEEIVIEKVSYNTNFGDDAFENGAEGSTGNDNWIDNRPLIDRIGDKNWKSRLSAYDDLKNQLKALANADGLVATASPLFTEYLSWISKMVADSNATALDAGLDTALVFFNSLPNVDGNVRSIYDKVCANVIDKSFNARPSTQAKGKAVILKLMEIDEPTACAKALLSKLSDKRPKIPTTCLDVLKEAVIAFGAKPFPIKDMIASFNSVFNGSNGSARESAMALLIELVRWVGKAPVNALLDAIRPAQKVEFEKLYGEVATVAAVTLPTVWLRSDRVAGVDVATIANAASNNVQKLDSREFIEEIDISKKLKATDYHTAIAEEKWSEQARALQLIVDILGPTPKMKSGCDVSDITSTCKGFLRQGHVQLQVLSLKIIALLADGLRSEFSLLARGVIQSVILKCKEKRLISEVQLALINMLKHCCTFDSFADDVTENIRNKKHPAHTRNCLMDFVTQAIVDMPDRISSSHLKALAEAFISCTEESDVSMREMSCNSLVHLQTLVNKRGKAAADASKVLHALETSMPRVYKRMQTPSIAAAPTSAPEVKAVPTTVKREDVPKKVSASSSSGSSSTAAVGASKKASAASTSTSASSGDKGEDDNVDDLAMTQEDAVAALTQLLAAPDDWKNIETAMAGSKWQEKVDALTLLGNMIEEKCEGGKYSAPLVVYLSSMTANFKISNVNILKSVISLACTAASKVGTTPFSKPAAWELLKNLGDKFSDKKTKDVVSTLLSALSSSISPGFVTKRMKIVMDKNKAPLTHQYYLEWLKEAVKEYGATAFPLMQLGAFCHTEMDNKISAVRQAAVDVMAVLYNQIGPKLLAIAITDDTKPAMKQLLEAEFAKIGYDPEALKKTMKRVTNSDGSVAAASVGDLVPRQDLCALLDKNILSELTTIDGKTSWQNRKAALEAITGACEKSGHFLDANKGTAEVVKALKVRMNDTQANLKPIAVSALGHVLSSLEVTSAAKYLKVIAEGLLSGLADNKKQMRDATITALQMVVTLHKVGGAIEMSLMSVLISPIGDALVATPIGRQELLTWLLGHSQALTVDCSELVDPLITTMQDKTATVRSLAEQLLTAFCSKGLISRLSLDKATRDLPTALKRTLQVSIDRMMTILLAKPAAASMAAVTASATVSVPHSASTVVAKSITHDVVPSIPPATAPAVAAVPPSKQAPAVTAAAVPPLPADMGSPSAEGKWMLKKTNKSKRLEDFSKMNWPQPSEEVGEHELNQLKVVWEPIISSELAACLFPSYKFGTPNQDSCIAGITELSTQLECPHLLMHLDLILRWCCYVLSLRESVTGLLKVLALITDLMLLLKENDLMLHDTESQTIIPHLIDKSGQKSERHRAAFKQVLALASDVVLPNKLNQYYLSGLCSKNKRSRVCCLEEILRAVDTVGATSLGRNGIKEVGQYLDNKDSDATGRTVCLDVCYSIHTSLGGDSVKFFKLIGDISERSASMIEERIKQKNKSKGTAVVPPIASTTASAPAPVSMGATTSTTITSSVQIIEKVATPVHSYALSNDDGVYEDSPFRLDMTPPGTVPSSPHVVAAAAASPKYDSSTTSSGIWRDIYSPVASQTPPPTVAAASNNVTTPTARKSSTISGTNGSAANELTGIYLDVSNKIERLLQIAVPVGRTDAVQEDAKDYLKVMHAILTGEWTSETQTTEDSHLLCAQCEPLAVQIVRCIKRSFDMPSTDPDTTVSSGSKLDVSLLAVSLATLFAMVKNKDVCLHLSQSTLLCIFSECTARLVDDRLSSSDVVEDDIDETITQVSRALNMVVLKLAAEAHTGLVLSSLIDAIFLCIPNQSPQGLPLKAAKPLSKLTLRILSSLTEESPMVKDGVHMHCLVSSIHGFFQRYPVNAISKDDIPFCTVKTILSELIKLTSASFMLSTLQALGITNTSFIYKLTCRLDKGCSSSSDFVSMNTNNTTATASVTTNVSNDVQVKLTAIIAAITSARDKYVHIQQLHQLRKEHPYIDISNSLNQMSSSVIKKFVLDTLAKYDSAEQGSLVIDENVRPLASKQPSRDAAKSPRTKLSTAIKGTLESVEQSLIDVDLIARLQRLKESALK